MWCCARGLRFVRIVSRVFVDDGDRAVIDRSIASTKCERANSSACEDDLRER